MAGALEGVRVIDFGQYIAGPLAAVMLADQGADVIHVDPPGGPRWSSPADAFFNRGKRRISLDLKTDGDLTIARRLIASADVVIENFRPGVMDRLGLGVKATAEQHPALIYCSLPGFAAADPRAGVQAWEGVIDAATENCRIREGYEPGNFDPTRPVYTAIPIASDFAAFMAAASIVMALIARHRSGCGQAIEVPLFNAMFEAIGARGTYVTAKGMPVSGGRLDTNGSGAYRCSDGRFVQFNPSQYRFLTWLAEAAGVSDWAAEGLFERGRLRSDPELLERLKARLVALFKTRSSHEWEELANQAGVPLTIVRTSAEWLANDHARSLGAVVDLDDPELGRTAMAGVPVHLTGSTEHVTGPRHKPDADRAEILAELDRVTPRTATEGQEPALRAALQGLRVVDLTQILAGPTGGRMLGEFGADVTKINIPHGRVAAHGFVNRGKRTVLLNVETPEGQDVFWKLVEQADVVLQNFPLGTAERYGIGYQQVKARKPDIVYGSVSCYGYGGPWGARRGYETQGQACTGIMERCGDEAPAVLGPYNLLDFGTGPLSTFAVALGLFNRLRTGEGQHVQASLAQTGTYHQTAYLLDYAGKVWDEPRGTSALGDGPLQRFYEASDGWFFMGVAPHEVGCLNQVEGLHGAAGIQGQALEIVLESRFKAATVDEWVNRLRGVGVGAHAVESLREVMLDSNVQALGLSVTQVSEEVGEVTMPGLVASLSGTPLQLGQPVRQPGADGRSVLEGIGLGDSIEALERQWALQVEGLPAGW